MVTLGGSRATLLTALATIACTIPRAASAPAPTTPAARATPSALPAPQDANAWAAATLAKMTLREQAAQMVWPSIVGDYMSADDERWARVERWITEDRVGGFTISVGTPLDIAAKLDAMQRASRVPLLFGADFEAGAGFRARGGVFLPNAIELGGATWAPPLMAIGATADTALAYRLGAMTADEGRALGVHIVYGPVLDVNNNSSNPVINVRSFGEDPVLVGRLGAAFVRGVQDHGMLATAKHFPGHGDTEVNSHLALPEVTASRARLDSVELRPFRAAVAAGVGAVMTFHGAMAALDSSRVPATLSPSIIGGLLRRDIGFRGVAITDAMDMRGVLDRFGAVDAAQRAVAAGADVLIQPVDVAVTIKAIEDGVAAGKYPASRVADAARRILAAKARLIGAGAKPFDPVNVRKVVGTVANQALADTIASRSITLVRDQRSTIPLRQGARVLSVTVARRTDLLAGVHFDAALRAEGIAVRSAFVDADAGTDADFARVAAIADSVDAVVVGSYVATRWDAATIAQSTAFVSFVRALAARPKGVITVALGNPYLLQQITDVQAYVVAWSGAPSSQRASARALAGRAPISGRLPISIPPVAERGTGIQRTAIR
ncbi:MAG TPA: glycoside hydrolase family 3 N-terminal domain-containing protein [Gemmatimonadaceae bacterium]|nr:glycoside hydrolase family 3 N-terminal domain-containing protein [Gemmatimonadaceae bacterium]